MHFLQLSLFFFFLAPSIHCAAAATVNPVPTLTHFKHNCKHIGVAQGSGFHMVASSRRLYVSAAALAAAPASLMRVGGGGVGGSVNVTVMKLHKGRFDREIQRVLIISLYLLSGFFLLQF